MVMRFQPGNDTEQSQGHDIEDDGGDMQDTVSSCAMGMNALRFHGIQCWWRVWGLFLVISAL